MRKRSSSSTPQNVFLPKGKKVQETFQSCMVACILPFFSITVLVLMLIKKHLRSFCTSSEVILNIMIKAAIFLLALCLLNTVSTAVPLINDEEKIVGGKQVTDSAKYPWEVSLGDMVGVPADKKDRMAKPENTKKSAHFCGGVLIHKEWVRRSVPDERKKLC